MIPKVSPTSRVIPTGGTWNRLANVVNGLPKIAESRFGSGRGQAVLVKNTTDQDADQFGALGLNGVVFTEDDNAEEYKTNATLSGLAPVVGTHDTSFVVLDEPIKTGEIGRAHITGICIARVDIQNDGDLRAGITDDNTNKLTSGSGPVQILHPTSGVTGETLCVVRLNAVEQMIPAEITAVGTDEKAGLHSIKLLQRGADAQFEDHPSGFTAEFAAREVNGTLAPVGSIVDLEFAGYKSESNEPLYIFKRSPATMLVKLMADGVTDGDYKAVAVSGSASSFTQPTGGAVFDGTDYPEIRELGNTPGLYRPGVDTVVEVTMVPNAAGGFDAYFSAEQPPAVAVVTSQDRVNHAVTANEVDPGGTLIAGGRKLGSIRVLTPKMPEIGQKITVAYGRIGNAFEWYTTQEQGDSFPAEVTASSAGSATWAEVAVGTHAAIADGRTGNASLPSGWQSMVVGTIVQIMPGPEGVYSVAAVVRGIKPDPATSTDQTPEVGSNGGIGIGVEDWSIDGQAGTGGLRAVAVGEAFIEGASTAPAALWLDRYSANYTSEGHLSDRAYIGSVGIGTDNADVAGNQVFGHISLRQVGDESGNPVLQPVLIKPEVNETAFTRIIEFQSGESGDSIGSFALNFDDSGRYKDGQLTDTITIDTAIIEGSEHIEVLTNEQVSTINLKPPQPVTSTFTIRDSPTTSHDPIVLVQDFSLDFDNSGRYTGGDQTVQTILTWTTAEIDVITDISFDTVNGLRVTKTKYRLVGTPDDPAFSGTSTTTVAGVTECP